MDVPIELDYFEDIVIAPECLLDPKYAEIQSLLKRNSNESVRGSQNEYQIGNREIGRLLTAANQGSVRDLSTEAKRFIATSLDAPPPIGLVSTWEDLARVLQMDTNQIQILRQRLRYPESPTLHILNRCLDMPVSRLLAILRDDLKRIDILINLQEYMPSSPVVSDSASMPNLDLPSSSMQYIQVQAQDAPAVSARNLEDSGLHSGPVAGPSIARHNHSIDNRSVSMGSNEHDRSQILMIYANDSQDHMKLVRQLCYNLTEHGKRHGTDLIEISGDLSGIQQDLTGYLEGIFQMAKSVVIVCTPSLRTVTETDSVSSSQAFTVKYLHRLMANEFRELGARNMRFRPVIFQDCDVGNVPLFLRNTIVYVWPRQHSDLCKALFKGL